MSEQISWLMLSRDFMKSKPIRLLMSLPDGMNIFRIYLELLLETTDSCGYYAFSGLYADTSAELAALTGEPPELMNTALNAMHRLDLVIFSDDGHSILLPYADAHTRAESSAAQRMRNMRKRRRNEQEFANSSNPTVSGQDGNAGVVSNVSESTKPTDEDSSLSSAPGDLNPDSAAEPASAGNDAPANAATSSETIAIGKSPTAEGVHPASMSFVKQTRAPVPSAPVPSVPAVSRKSDRASPRKKRETSEQIFERMSKAGEAAVYSTTLEHELQTWFRYLDDINHPVSSDYTMARFLKEVTDAAARYGDSAACRMIDKAIRHGWKSVYFDELSKPANGACGDSNASSDDKDIPARLRQIANW